MNFFVGIDPSLNATGLVLIDAKGKIHEEKLIHTINENYLCIEQRLLDILNDIKISLLSVNLKAACIEGLSYFSISPTLYERCGLLYLITTFLFENDIPFKLIPPKSLKKWAVGNGNADKKIMMNQSGKRWGINFIDDNICDAFNLAQMSRLT